MLEPRRRTSMFHFTELLHEWQTRQNRPLGKVASPDASLALWSRDGGDVAQAFDPLAGTCELLIVLTTYKRPGGAARVLARLGEALARRPERGGVALLVLHDACGQDYGAAREAARALGVHLVWLDARSHLGKEGFWRTHQTALCAARAWRPRRALYLQDDLDFDADLLERAEALWQATASDAKRRVLYLFSCEDDEPQGRWIYFRRHAVPGAACRWTNWFDLQAFMVDHTFFELLGYRMVPIHSNRWKRQPEKSSGVGRQLTRRLFGRGHVYQAWPALVRHGVEPSTMNPEARKRRPLDNHRR